MVKKQSRPFPVRGRAKGELEKFSKKQWRAIERAAADLRKLGDGPLTEAQAAKLGEKFGVHANTIYRYRSRLRQTGETTSIRGRKRGWKASATRLTAKQEAVIENSIASLRKKPGPLRLVDLVRDVDAHCRIEQIPCPSRPTIDRRLKQTHGIKVSRRGVALPGNADPRISPGTYVIRRSLEVVQIDHTTMDIVVVDDLYRQPLGQPYLTLATDVATRSILGFVISFIPPGASTVALCLTMVVSPKEQWLHALGIERSAWPMHGLPSSLHLDGAAEFKSKALRRGCSQYGIRLHYRERPHHGGHVERLLGTKMSQLKALPGATGGSVKARRDFDPDKHSALTLRELEAWFTRQIVGQYHQSPHRGLRGCTPIGAWGAHPSSSLPPESIKRFRIAFLPAVERTLRRDGLVLHHLRYWHPIFSSWLGTKRKLTVHFDARDLSAVYIPYEKDYLEVRYADLRQPPVSLWEAQAATKFLRESGRNSINPTLLIQTIEEQRKLVSQAQQKTRITRRRSKTRSVDDQSIVKPLTQPPLAEETEEIDWSVPVEPYDGETW